MTGEGYGIIIITNQLLQNKQKGAFLIGCSFLPLLLTEETCEPEALKEAEKESEGGGGDRL